MRLAKILQRQQAPTRSQPEAARVPKAFVAFCAWLGVELTPGQRQFARIAYDGEPADDAELAARLFGPIGHVPDAARSVVAAVCGARGGKTYALVALRLVHGMLVRDLTPLRPGQRAYATIIAPNNKLRQEAVNYALGAFRQKPELRALLRLPRGTRDEDSPAEFGVWREDFRRVVTFSGAVATGYSARGRWHTDFALDEAAFFGDENYAVSDVEIFRAGSARVLPGGQTIVPSTPWAEAGLLYDLWKENFGKPTTALVAHAGTLTLNDSAVNRAIVERERQRDPDNARREFDAAFVTSGTTVFFEAATLDAAVTDEPFQLKPDDEIAAGGDFGFRSDSSALILVAMRDEMVHVFDGTEVRPGDGAPLKPSVTVATFAKLIAGRCDYLMADSHYREAIAEHLDTHGLVFAPAPTTPADTYVRARMLLREGRVRIHRLGFRDRMVQQMREVQGRPLPGGGMSIIHPRWARGGHGDLAAALVLATWQVSGEPVKAPKPKLGTAEWEEAAREARRQEYLRQQATPVDRGRNAHWRR